MTPEEIRKAELAETDRKRREKELLLLALLLGIYGYGRQVVSGSIRAGHDPQSALNRVFLGNGTPHFPGIAGKLANGLADIDLAARENVTETANAAIAKATPKATEQPATPSPTPTPAARKGSEPDSETQTAPTAPESQPAAKAIEPAAKAPVLPAKADVARGYKAFANQTAEEMRQNVSALAQDVMDHAKDVGASINQIVVTMREAFAARGWTDKNPVGTKKQAITMASRAWSSGSFAGWRQPGVWTAIKGFEFVTVRDSDGQPDARVCPVCHPLNGLKLARDDPRWTHLWANRHYVCRCVMRAIFGDFAPTEVPANLPPAQPGFGMIPSLSVGYSAFGTL